MKGTGLQGSSICFVVWVQETFGVFHWSIKLAFWFAGVPCRPSLDQVNVLCRTPRMLDLSS